MYRFHFFLNCIKHSKASAFLNTSVIYIYFKLLIECFMVYWQVVLTAMMWLGVIIMDLELKPWAWVKLLASGKLQSGQRGERQNITF